MGAFKRIPWAFISEDLGNILGEPVKFFISMLIYTYL